MAGKLIIFSAPSGSGKSTIINYLLTQNLNLSFSISATSRAPRGTEQNGVEYFFLTPEEFKQRIANNEFLEEEPETAKKFLTALRDGYEYAIENPQEAADILCEAAPELDPELVLASQEYLKDQYKAEVSQWGYIDPERWNAFYQWLNENGLTEAEIPENAGFSNDYLPE